MGAIVYKFPSSEVVIFSRFHIMAFFNAAINFYEFLQVEAKDPASGASYYYNKNTGKSQWVKPIETSQHPSPSSFPAGWIEAFDETTGMQ